MRGHSTLTVPVECPRIRIPRLRQPVNQRQLTGEDLAAGAVEVEPGDTINFWEFLPATGLRRPLDGEQIAAERIGIEMTADGPGDDPFATGLPDLTERHESTVDRLSHFFFEFPSRRRQRILSFAELAFRDRPRPVVLFRPERPAWVREQHLETAIGRSKDEKTGADFGHGEDEEDYGDIASSQSVTRIHA